MSAIPGVLAEETKEPKLWLEDVTGEKALIWVKSQNAETVGKLTKNDAFKQLDERLLKILDSQERLPMIRKAGEHYYNFWRDAKNPRGLWRRTSLEEYKKPEPRWQTVLDLDVLGEREKENWVWEGASFLRPMFDRCLISLSRGGADATVVREFDLKTQDFIKDGFYVPEAKSTVSWRDRDSVFVATDFGSGSLTKSMYPRIVKEWKRGTPLASATLVYEAKEDDLAASASKDLTRGFEREFVNRQITFYTSEQFVRRDGKLVKLDIPLDAEASAHRDLLFIQLRSAWKVGDKTFAAGAYLASDFEGFMKGERRFDVLFEPTPRKSLADATPTRNHLILNELDNVRNRLYFLHRENGVWRREPLPGMPNFATVHASAVDAHETDDYFLTVEGYLEPTTLSLGSAGKGAPEKLKQSPSFFDARGLVVSQHETKSKDGTVIPYFQVAPKDLALHGNNPTVLYGYGGFEISMVPSYAKLTGAAWMEKGGVYVVANIRGGGEFGPSWHQAALKANRQRAYDDFIAVAEDLMRRKVTSTKHFGIMGGSNGGLLMGNMLVQRPDLFGAVVCQVPLLDMRRYHKLLAGASWMDEYGNPDDPKEWEFLQKYSPYQRVQKGVNYPPILITTSTRDDRVHPGHARKMVAKLKELGQPVLYYENIEGGHGGAANNRQSAFMAALAYQFFWERLK